MLFYSLLISQLLPIGLVVGMAGKVSDEDMFRLEKRMKKSEAIIASMSEEERTTPDLLARQVRTELFKKSRTSRTSGDTFFLFTGFLKFFLFF